MSLVLVKGLRRQKRGKEKKVDFRKARRILVDEINYASDSKSLCRCDTPSVEENRKNEPKKIIVKGIGRNSFIVKPKIQGAQRSKLSAALGYVGAKVNDAFDVVLPQAAQEYYLADDHSDFTLEDFQISLHQVSSAFSLENIFENGGLSDDKD